MARRARGGDAAVVVGVPVGFAVLATVLALSTPSSAAGPQAVPAAPATASAPAQAPRAGEQDRHQDGGSEGIGVAVDAHRGPISSSDVKVVSRVKTRKPVYFITVDDGTWKTKSALRVVQRHGIPVTVFLTSSAIEGQAEYFRKFTQYGGSVQNHTRNHEYFNRPSVDVEQSICSIQKSYTKLFGTEPWMLRPPGGFGYDSPRVHAAAASCGIDQIVMWDVVVTDTDVQFVDAPLKRGDIVILHFTKGLAGGLERVLAMGRQQGLRPASLADYLREPRAR